MSEKQISPRVKVLTGIRSSGDLTIANFIGALHPIIEIKKKEDVGKPYVFVADMHALTTNEPKETQERILEVVKDYIALGLNFEDFNIYVQSYISSEISEMSIYLSRLITVAEILRVPTLKEKIKQGMGAETANVLLALYPIMMASDILIQQTEYVPVGEDQVAHLEVARYLANKFNKRYGDTFVVPKVMMIDEPKRLMSLSGNGGKMSKSDPSGAIILNEDVEISLKKVKKAKTAFAGEMSVELETLVDISEFVCTDEEKESIKKVLDMHMGGENVMGEFKDLLNVSLKRFILDFQEKRASLKDEDILKELEKAGVVAKENAQYTLKKMKEAMGMRYISN